MGKLLIELGSDIQVCLQTNAAEIISYWERLLEGWVRPFKEGVEPDISLTFELVDQLPERPAAAPIFVDEHAFYEQDLGNLEVYAGETADSLILYFRNGGLVEVSRARPLRAHGYVNRKLLLSSRFEDALFTTLAPLLRRCGLFVIHAFGASVDGQGVLIVGPSGSGKTTTGLRLVLDGWSLLSNDGVAYAKRPEGVYGFPTPGLVSIRPHSFELLPELNEFVNQERFAHEKDKAFLPAQRVARERWSTAVPLRRIYFPRIEDREDCYLKPLHRAVGLALLMEESVDRWDAAVLGEHVAVLQGLTEQTELYTLHLGRDISRLADLLRPGGLEL